jgi:hypothetical protein
VFKGAVFDFSPACVFFPYAQSFAALLRTQRDTGLHAPESGAAQTRLASEGLTVEQLGALPEGRDGVDSD